MLQAILGLFNTIFGFLGNLLPDSPFTDMVQVNDQLILGISWLNWLVPINEMLAMMVVWLGACVAVVAVRVALDVTGSIGGKVSGS